MSADRCDQHDTWAPCPECVEEVIRHIRRGIHELDALAALAERTANLLAATQDLAGDPTWQSTREALERARAVLREEEPR